MTRMPVVARTGRELGPNLVRNGQDKRRARRALWSMGSTGGLLGRAARPSVGRADPRRKRVKATYRALAYLVPVLVALQATFITLGVFGLGAWVDDGNDFTKSVLESDSSSVTGGIGFALHNVGAMALALVGLLLLVLSFFAKIPGGVKWAALVLVGRRPPVGAGLRLVRRLGGRGPARAQRLPALRSRHDGRRDSDPVDAHVGRPGAFRPARVRPRCSPASPRWSCWRRSATCGSRAACRRRTP